MSQSENQRVADQKAFARGQDDWRAGQYNNPYPPQSQYYELWQQGQDKERETELG